MATPPTWNCQDYVHSTSPMPSLWRGFYGLNYHHGSNKGPSKTTGRLLPGNNSRSWPRKLRRKSISEREQLAIGENQFTPMYSCSHFARDWLAIPFNIVGNLVRS